MSGPEPTSRYRAGDRDLQARRAHADDSRQWRRRNAEAAFGPQQQAVVVDAVSQGVPVPQAAAAVGMTQQGVYGRAQVDAEFAARLDKAQRAAAPAATPHGTMTGYRWWGCRCRACRAAKDGG